MINWDAVAKWRDELRSDNYNQTKYALKTETGYCCMGVFCEAVAKIKPSYNATFTFQGEGGVLPDNAIQLLGNFHSNIKLFGEWVTNLNDNMDCTFQEIADLLDIAILEHEAGVTDSELIL